MSFWTCGTGDLDAVRMVTIRWLVFDGYLIKERHAHRHYNHLKRLCRLSSGACAGHSVHVTQASGSESSTDMRLSTRYAAD